MKTYHSTRNLHIQASFHEAVLQGIASDGGLFVKDDIQKDKIDLDTLLHASYQEMAIAVLSKFLDDFSNEQIEQCVYNAYNTNFDTTEITPLVKVGKHHVLELFHGPTCAFKDIALQILPQFMQTALQMEPNHKDIVILTATSGDTGKAALEGFKDVDKIKIIVFYPYQLVSEMQERQMITTTGKNTAVISLHGNFDDCQRIVKQAFANNELVNELNNMNYQFSSANSINIGRLCPQITYYFYSYMQLVKNNEIQLHDKVNFVVPTGNFGNILAGYYAKLLGLPIHKLICASNSNHILTDFISTGIYDRNRNLEKTISPSMDILISSNLERLLYELHPNTEDVAKWMKQLNENGRYEIPQELLDKIQDIFHCGYANDDECKQTINYNYKANNYVMDTHTSCAAKVLEDYLKDTNDTHKSIILSTASCYKFSKDVLSALDDQPYPSEWEYMNQLQKVSKQPISENLSKLKEMPILHHNQTTKEDAFDTILSIIKEKF